MTLIYLLLNVTIVGIGAVIIKNKELSFFMGLNDRSIKGRPAIIIGFFLIIFGILGSIQYLQ